MSKQFDNKLPEQSSERLLWGVVVSVLVHVTLFLARSPYQRIANAPELEPPSAPIEIAEVPEEYLAPPPPEAAPPEPKETSPQEKAEPEIAETEDAGNRDLDPNATILSDRTQTAQQQTKASKIDDFRAQKGTGLKTETKGNDVAPTGDDPSAEAEASPLDLDGIGVTQTKTKGVQRDWKELSIKDLSIGGDGGEMASTDDRLRGIEEGERTVLSTKEFRYFSYYHRIKEVLRQHWKPAVQRKVALIWAKGKNIKSSELTTRLLILLDNEGGIRKISRLGTSGHTEVDSAAMEAFRKAAPFPNPPVGIVDPDGFVRIRWDFILKAQAAPQIRYQRAPGRPMP